MLEEEGIDIALVGDSLGMVELGLDNTLSVTMDEMIYHAKAVSRAVSNTMMVVDMPFMSYQVSMEDALVNAGRVLKETKASAVKMEGGALIVPKVRALVEAGIPVMGHIGLMPQYIHSMGGYKVQGMSEEQAKKLVEDAKLLEEAGVFSIVLEGVKVSVAKEITSLLKIATIGIGAGIYCNGQVLVFHDLLGITPNPPRFARAFADARGMAKKALSRFIAAVHEKVFPNDMESYL